tara:strand:+ start:121 stop:792 length:672 start_codon:yes stop_codon:yes gene_type:complete
MLVKDVYVNFRKEAELPLRLRGKTVIGRDGDVVPRRHHLNYKAVYSHSRALEEGYFCIPYRKGIRSSFLAALFELGLNAPHCIKTVIDLTKTLASSNHFRNSKGQTALQVLFARSGEMNDEQLEEKLLAEICELQRLTGMHPYGLKLAQMGFCVDIVKLNGKDLFIRLRGGIKEEVVPVNQTRKSYKKNGKPIIPSIKGYDINSVREWKIDKAQKLYPIEEEM